MSGGGEVSGGGGDTVGGDVSGGGDTSGGGGDKLGDLDLLFFLPFSGTGDTLLRGGEILAGDLFFFIVLPGGLGLLNFALYAVTGG